MNAAWARFVELYRYREMLWSLILSELRTRYKASVLGFLWTFANPLLTLIVYTLIFSTILKVTMPNYAEFMFVGILAWNLFSSGVLASSSVIVRQSSLVKKIYFPREILPLSVVGGSAINYLLSLLILIPILLLAHLWPTWVWIYLPLAILIEVILTSGLALLFSALNVYFRDLEHMLGIILMLWFYLTPIVYSVSLIPPKYVQIFKLNPIADVVMAMQMLFYYRHQPHWKMLVYSGIESVVIFAVGWIVFNRLSRRFAEEV